MEDKVLITNYGISKRTQGISISDDFGEKVFCKCRENKIPDNSCTTGGRGSTECSQTITVGPVTQSCDTKCDVGHYACCWAD